MKKIIIEDTDLIQGRYHSLIHRYPDKIVITVNNSTLTLPKQFCEFMKLKMSDEILFAKNTSGIYVCNATDKHKKEALLCHSLSSKDTKSGLQVSAKKLLIAGIQKGVYELEQEEYFDNISKISWYKLNFIE